MVQINDELTLHVLHLFGNVIYLINIISNKGVKKNQLVIIVSKL